MAETNTIRCGRCGNCCKDVGRTFWKAGDYPHSELATLRHNDDHEDAGLPCEMLMWISGKSTCAIHLFLGEEFKPEVCREHDGDNRCRPDGTL